MKNDFSVLYKLRFVLIVSFVLLIWMVYANYTGWRVMSFEKTESWSSSGPGYHK